MQTKLPSERLMTGMFVADIDRPWIGTPFWFQGFLIENDEHLMQLRKYCKFVMVDPERSTSNVQATISSFGEKIEKKHRSTADPFSDHGISVDFGELNELHSFIPDNIQLTPFRNIVPIEAELAPAGDVYTRTTEVLNDLFRDLTSNNFLALKDVDSVIQGMVESMIRNPDALMLVSRMRQEDKTVYGHGVNVAIYLVAMGRHLSLPKGMLEHLGTLGLLLDIGKTRLPRTLLQKEGRLTSEEFETVKSHVPVGLEILFNTPNLHPDILEGVAQHHERENGSGYPAGKAKGEITLFGRMAAIADTFSAMTNPRPYSEIVPAYQALQAMVNLGRDLYHAPMVEQFIHAIGIFPVGTMVELSTGEVAVVLSHSKVRRLKPRVLIISGKDKKPLQVPASLDLLHPPTAYEVPPSILSGLPAGAYGLNPREYYLG
jgi:HD-GYP domain-containing protein (c-di-GMP phosphodiesterase class II)